MFWKGVTAWVMASVVASCSVVGPNYRQPDISLASQFALAPASSLREAANDAWWSALSDPVLDRLVKRALAQNLDVKSSVARIEEAQALLRTTGANALARGDIELSARGRGAEGGYTDTSQAQFAPSFIIDLFGGNLRRQQAAEAVLDRAIYQAAASRLALQLELVTTYVDLRYFQELEALRTRAIANQRHVVEAVKERERVQADSKFTLRRAEAELQLQRALLPETKQGQRTSVLRLATLLAEPVAPLMDELLVSKPQLRPAQNIAPGLPAGLLKNRPDVRAAQAALAAAVAQVGISEAQLYPSLRLTGVLTVSQDSALSLGPTLTVPLLGRKARLAGRDAAIARASEAELAWRSVVLESVEEVQINLSQLQTSDQQVSALVSAVSKFREAATLSREAFRLQAITQVEILDVEDSLTQTELRLSNARRVYARAWARLNVAIGQGWHAEIKGDGS